MLVMHSNNVISVVLQWSYVSQLDIDNQATIFHVSCIYQATGISISHIVSCCGW